MRLTLGVMLLGASLASAACTANEAKAPAGANGNSAAANREAGAPSGAGLPPGSPSVASSHGGAARSSPAGDERAAVDTAELDAKIKAAVAKAKGPKAKTADKRALAAAYLERGNLYWSAQNPFLYKYALADFNSVLLYQPDNAEAKEKRDEIIRIYNSMGRPVPQVSNEK